MPRTAHGEKLRRGRYSEPGRIYLITAVCHQRRAHFRTLMAGRCFVRALKETQSEAATLCYVVMPDHVHWLLQLQEGANLSGVVQKAKSLATRRARQQFAIEGPLWQRGFHDHALRREEDLRAVARYVVANPVRAGLVDRLGAYSLWDAVWV